MLLHSLNRGLVYVITGLVLVVLTLGILICLLPLLTGLAVILFATLILILGLAILILILVFVLILILILTLVLILLLTLILVLSLLISVVLGLAVVGLVLPVIALLATLVFVLALFGRGLTGLLIALILGGFGIIAGTLKLVEILRYRHDLVGTAVDEGPLSHGLATAVENIDTFAHRLNYLLVFLRVDRRHGEQKHEEAEKEVHQIGERVDPTTGVGGFVFFDFRH